MAKNSPSRCFRRWARDRGYVVSSQGYQYEAFMAGWNARDTVKPENNYHYWLGAEG